MLINHDPDEFTGEVRAWTCAFHEANPGKPYAGCTCGASYGIVRRSPEEVAKIKRAKRIAHEESVLAEAAAIRARRKRRNGDAAN